MDDEEDSEHASEEENPSHMWFNRIFLGVCVLVYILASLYSGDWSIGWTYRST